MTSKFVPPAGSTKTAAHDNAARARVAAIARCVSLALLTVSFCSCQSLVQPARPANSAIRSARIPRVPMAQQPVAVHSTAAYPVQQVSYMPAAPSCGCCSSGPHAGLPHTYASLPPDAWTGPANESVPWRPPHIPGPWPRDEYIFDGGDHPTEVRVDSNFNVLGLHEEDTIVHYDTLDGNTVVEPTNTVAIYAPRFGAVRRVYGLALHEQHLRPGNSKFNTQLNRIDERSLAGAVTQPEQVERQVGTKLANSFRERLRGVDVENAQGLLGVENGYSPYENFRIIRDGVFDSADKPRLAKRMMAAVAWSDNAAVQVVIDGKMATQATDTTPLHGFHAYEMPKGKPRLRVVKVASKDNALPGDIVDFTIRFDNVGDQLVGNVTIVDNLTARLEYVEDSASCTIDAEFFAVENDQESLILRWEVTDPLDVGKGGVIRFQCRVR